MFQYFKHSSDASGIPNAQECVAARSLHCRVESCDKNCSNTSALIMEEVLVQMAEW